jgi:hypothetical protein
MSLSKQTGDVLEAAVSAIEHAILRNSPVLRKGTFEIEPKKLICIDGVHHEIDIYVVINAAHGYQSVFIFECKNWKKSVGKNEIVDFSEKIKVVQAAHGTFVAKSFTKDARAQAKKDPRMDLLVAKEHDPDGTPVPFDFHGVIPEFNTVHVSMFRWGSTQSETSPIDIRAAKADLHGAVVDLNEYFTQCAREASNESMRTFSSGKLPEGTYDRTAESERRFEKGQLQVNGDDIEVVKLTVPFKIHLFRKVVCHFEVESRGRAITFAPVAFAGTTMQLRLVSHE